jgi:hypothetical protein
MYRPKVTTNDAFWLKWDAACAEIDEHLKTCKVCNDLINPPCEAGQAILDKIPIERKN